MLKSILYFISAIILFFLIFNGLAAIKEMEDEEEKHGALISQFLLFVVWLIDYFLYLN